MTTANAAVLTGQDADFEFKEIEVRDIRADEILVKITATGLCHTDLAVQHGQIPSPFPIVLGHEGAGIVEQVGSGVTGFEVGDRVAASFTSCGHCLNCEQGKPAYCLNFMPLNFGGAREDGSVTLGDADGNDVHGSFFGQSSFATYAIISPRNAVKVPDDVPLEIVGPLGCGIQTGAGTVLNSLGVRAGESIVVSGTGAVGLSAIMAAKAAGATTIIAVDVLEERLQFAAKLGATHTINGKADDVADQIKAATGGLGAKYGLDTTGVPAVIQNLIAGTQFGAQIAVLGATRPDSTLPLNLVSAAGKSLVGAIEGDAVPQTFIPRLLDLYRAGDFPFDQLITTYPFSDMEKAIADTASGVSVKAVLVM
ncbi:NAD(P)-dependent alcohol dehydrogenase [Nocardioides sp. GY 10127]|uniref:NAD(P)-dependent alcohol dehydrogenase n=1 Tax=Nocardioides sp. GY 10127 TaxID=2569762 RepID=UPI0010A88236|nr:NAD(P)-dependent alcohol dehydrogenase [Nocardioides sp. GY 10127]TIC83947.1 NAD(P)-dependent alcohol dehydrogenase [Nocardioides sp. GY 10127]